MHYIRGGSSGTTRFCHTDLHFSFDRYFKWLLKYLLDENDFLQDGHTIVDSAIVKAISVYFLSDSWPIDGRVEISNRKPLAIC